MLESLIWVLFGKICSARFDLCQIALTTLFASHSFVSLSSFQGPQTCAGLLIPHKSLGVESHIFRCKTHGGLKWTRTIDLTLIRRAL